MKRQLLLARAWIKSMWHSIYRSSFKRDFYHREITYSEYGKIVEIVCECGKVFYKEKVAIKEHDLVILLKEVKGVPAGARGTVVHVYSGKIIAFEVEFNQYRANIERAALGKPVFDNSLLTLLDHQVKKWKPENGS